MTIVELCSIAAGLFSAAVSLWYIWSVLHGGRPKWVTWFIWGTLDLIILAGMWRGGHVTNWQIISCSVFAWVTFILALKFGVPGWNRVDKACLIGAAVSIVLLWHYPAWALAMSLLATCVAAMPTYVSAWEDPTRENFAAWMLGVIPGALILCIVPWTFAAAAQPATFLVVNGTVPLIILVRRR